MAAQLIRSVATIVRIIANLRPINAPTIRALVLRIQIARFRMRRTQCHIVLVRTVAAIVHTVADLIARHATAARALEPAQCVAIEVRAYRRRFVGIVAAIVGPIAQIRRRYAQIVGALESRFRTISAAREARRTIGLVGHIATVAIAVATEIRGNAVTGRALERTVLALETLAVQFVGAVAAVVFVIATPATRDAFAVAAAELRFGAFAIVTLAEGVRFVGAVAAIVGEVTRPLSGMIVKFCVVFR